MIRRPPLLIRLRRHRGLWALALAVLLIKLTAGTLCLSDTPAAFSATDTPTVHALVQSVAADASDAYQDGCVLGEAGGCHCQCAHNLPVPSFGMSPLAGLAAAFAAPPISIGTTPAFAGSLLRPPIA